MDIKEIRKYFPLKIAEELNSVQRMPNLSPQFIEWMNNKSQTQIFKCSCGKILLETTTFNLKETEKKCECGKIWELKPICETTRLMWKWNIVK